MTTAKADPKPFMIAVTGGTGSGKSTLATALADRLAAAGCAVVTEDNYYLPRAEHTPRIVGWSNEEVERTINFDDPATKDMAMFRRHLEALRAGEAIEQPVYDFATHERIEGERLPISPPAVVIVEGVHVLSDPGFADLFDLKVFVDAPVDIRLIRRLRRDRDERGRDIERTIGQYLSFVRKAHARFTEPAREICDLVVGDSEEAACGPSRPSAEQVDALVAPVWAILQARGVIA